MVTFDLEPELVKRIEAAAPAARVITLGQGTRARFEGRLPYPSEMQMAVPAEEVAAALGGADVLFSSWTGALPGIELAAAAPGVRWVQLTHAGAERVDPARTGEVVFTTVGGMSSGPIAEWVIGCMLMFAKGWPAAFRNQQEHAYRRYMPRELAGSTVGIVGLGMIGSEVAQRTRALGCHTIGIRRSFSAPGTDPLVDEALPPSALHDLLGASDYVVLSAPLTPETRGMVDTAALRAMRPEGVLLNVGRGALIDEAALVEALREERIAGAALDVFAEEPLPASSPLWDLERLILTPHIAAGTNRYYERATDIFCGNLRRWMAGEPLEDVVDHARGY